jgi:MFS family permease
MKTGRFSGDAVTARIGPARLVRAGGLIVAVGLAAGLATNTVPTMILGIACVGVGLSGVVPTVFRAGGRLPGIPAGTALATIATLSYAGFLVGPPLIGFISESWTLRAGLIVIVILAGVLAALGRVVAERPA